MGSQDKAQDRLENLNRIINELYEIAQSKYPNRQIEKIRQLVREYVDNLPIENLIQLHSHGIKKIDLYWYIALKIFRKYSIAIRTSYDRLISYIGTKRYDTFEKYYLPKEPTLRELEPLIFPTIDEKGFLLLALKPHILKGDKDMIKLYIELIKSLPKKKQGSLIKATRKRKKKLEDVAQFTIEDTSPSKELSYEGDTNDDLLSDAEIIDG